VAESPEVAGADSGDDQVGSGHADRDASRLEAIGMHRPAVHPGVEPDEVPVGDEPTDRVGADAVGQEFVATHDAVSVGGDPCEFCGDELHRSVPCRAGERCSEGRCDASRPGPKSIAEVTPPPGRRIREHRQTK